MLIIIRAVPEREALHEYLRERLPDAEWVMEDSNERSAESFTRSLGRALHQQGRRGAVHLDDDVILTRDFEPKVKRAVGQYWTYVVQLFSARQAHVKPVWASARSFCHGPAVWMPGHLAPILADYQDRLLERGLGTAKSYDDDGYRVDQGFAIGAYLHRRGRKYRIHSPSLVQHRAEDSTLGHVTQLASGRPWQSLTFTDPWE